MDLVEDRSTRAELDKEVDVGILVVFASRYRAKHLDAQCVPTIQETLDLRRMRNHDVTNRSHARFLSDGALARQDPRNDEGPLANQGPFVVPNAPLIERSIP